ncbi:MAG: hypothetical protein J6X67_02225 [Treponema sp.]|nr:hypothetical protein [Treponema sp.]
MKKVVFFVLSLLFAVATLNAKEKQSVRDKIDSLLANRVIELDNEELKSFKNQDFGKKIITKLNEIDSAKELTDAICDYIEVGNYEIINAIKLDKDSIFLNYLIRSDVSVRPKNNESERVLDPFKVQHHLLLIYDMSKKEISETNYISVNYTPILFHKYDYKGKSLLYGIGNNSSSGMATTDIYLLALSTKNFELIFSECILFSQSFYSKGMEDIKFEKDFVFNGDKIEITGKDFDFDNMKYVDYSKTYMLY